MCKTDKQNEENMSSTKTYTISEAKFVKFVILAICDDVADGFNEFELLEENDGYIKQIIGQIYGKGAENTNKILELVDLIPEIGKKYLFIAALYDAIMLKKDITSAILIFEVIREFKLLNTFSDLDDSTQGNIEVMLKVLEMLMAYSQNDPQNNEDKIVSSYPIIHQQNDFKEIQENVNKLQTELEELKSKIDLDKITLAIDYTSAQLDAIKIEKEMINKWDQQLILWTENACNFESICKIVNQLREIESNVFFPDNKKQVTASKLSLPEIRIFASSPKTKGMKLKNGEYYMHSTFSGTTPILSNASDKAEASSWIFETNANETGFLIKSLSTHSYVDAGTFGAPMHFLNIKERENPNYYWKLYKNQWSRTYDIINTYNSQPLSITRYSKNFEKCPGWIIES